MNAGSLLTCSRLQTIRKMIRCRWVSSAYLAAATGSVAVSTDVAALRQQLRRVGRDVRCRYAGMSTSGARVYQYREVSAWTH